MDHLANPENANVEQLRFRRRQTAAQVRSLLEQLEIAEREFEKASRELSEAESQTGEVAA